jgi:Flp pilus assembly protein TadD
VLLDGPGAIAALGNAVKENPNDAVAQYRLGAEYLREGQIDAALEHLRKSYQLKPDDQSTLNSLQMALRQHGDVQQADAIRKQLADLLRERDRVNQNKLAAVRINNEGAALEKNGDLRGALEKYRQATQLDPTHVGIQINYGVALLRLGNWEQGLNVLHTALQQDPNNRQLRAAIQDALTQAPSWAIPAWAKNGKIE